MRTDPRTRLTLELESPGERPQGLVAGHFAPVAPGPARWAYAGFALTAGLAGAWLLAHWIDGALKATALHPGYLLPVASGSFVASIGAPPSGGPPGVGRLRYRVALLGLLRHGRADQPGQEWALPAAARQALAVLCIPPGAGGLAWIATHQGELDEVGYGFVGVTAFTVLVVAFLVPDLHRLEVHPGLWVLSFPVAVTANLTIRIAQDAGVAGELGLVTALVGAATLVIAWLATATLAFGVRERLTRRRSD